MGRTPVRRREVGTRRGPIPSAAARDLSHGCRRDAATQPWRDRKLRDRPVVPGRQERAHQRQRTRKEYALLVQKIGRQEIGGVAPRPVTPEGTRDGWLSSDGKLVLARGPEGKYSIYPIAGGEPWPVPGLTETDVIAQWSADGRSVLVYRRAEIPCRLERLELATGHRTLFKEFAPTDRAGLLSMREIFITDDLRSYAYTAYYQVASLFVSEGGK